MQREILFRGQDEDKNWVEGDLIHGVGHKSGKLFILPRKVNLAYIKNCDPLDGVEVIPETVGQFTGLTDKNGKKIFSDELRKDNDGVVFRIYHVYGGFIMKAHYWKSDCKDLIPIDELIFEPLSNPQTAQWIKESTDHVGNTHDNPELLK